MSPVGPRGGWGEQRLLVGDTVQTRRNDKVTGVENRAQWIVRDIRDDFVDLVSEGDSGELRRVSAEYAREHVQFSYASTVHGMQGDRHRRRVSGRARRGCRRAICRSHPRAGA